MRPLSAATFVVLLRTPPKAAAGGIRGTLRVPPPPAPAAPMNAYPGWQEAPEVGAVEVDLSF